MEGSGFPWLTIRERSELWRFRPSFVDPTSPDRSKTVVSTPDGGRFDVTDPALATQLGHGARVIKQNRGVFDASPLSLITTQTVEHLAANAGRDLEALRFRPTLVVDAVANTPFAEDGWVGGVRTRGCSGRARTSMRAAPASTRPRSNPGRVAVGDPVSQQ